MKSDDLRRGIKIRQGQLEDLKHGVGSSLVRQQIKTDKQIKKERFDKECREINDVYRVKCVDVVNYNDNNEIQVMRINNSLSDKLNMLKLKVHLYSNLGLIDTCVVFTKRYKDKKLQEKLTERNEKFWKKYTDGELIQ